MIITIPFKTPSINHLHGFWRGHVVLKAEARKLKANIKEIVDNTDSDIKPLLGNVMGLKLKVNADIYEDWYYGNGDINKKDVANREKFLIDSIFEALELDDKHIWESSFRKIQSTTDEKAIISIEVI
jgi:hypothetical protein